MLTFRRQIGLLIIILVGATVTFAWAPQPAYLMQIFQPMSTIADGYGGMIAVATRGTIGQSDIYAQRVDALGVVQWTAGGLPICTLPSAQEYPAVAPDGLGGAIVTWVGYHNGGYSVRAQRVDAAGTVKWATNGVDVEAPTPANAQPAIAADGAHGAIIAWGTGAIEANRIGPDGQLLWSSPTPLITTTTGNKRLLVAIPDGFGGAIVGWSKTTSAPLGHVARYVQRVDAYGNVQWGSDALVVAAISGNGGSIQLCSDGAGGVIACWWDSRAGFNEIRAQRVTAVGAIAWTPGGVLVADADDGFNMTSDGSGGAILTWSAYEPPANVAVRAQRLDARGNSMWDGGGLVVCDVQAGAKEDPRVAGDGRGGGFIAWSDGRHDFSDRHLYAAYVQSNGSLAWPDSGVLISAEPEAERNPRMVASNGAAIIAWNDDLADAYAQRVASDGTVGEDPLTIRVTARVREAHDDDPFVTPDPPLPGATVTLDDGIATVIAQTDAHGMASFDGQPGAGAQYKIELRGDQYDVRTHTSKYGPGAPPIQWVPVDPVQTHTEFTWPSGDNLREGPSAQLAYYLAKFQTEYLSPVLDYEWRLPLLIDPGASSGALIANLKSFACCNAQGGAYFILGANRHLNIDRRKVFEADVIYHEFTHAVVVDRFADVAGIARGITRSTGSTVDAYTEGAAMDEAVADYFAASFTNDPKIDDCGDPVGPLCFSKRNLTKQMCAPTIAYQYEAHEASLIISGPLWHLRGLIDGVNASSAPITDRLVLDTIDRMAQGASGATEFYFTDFYDAIKAEDADNGGTYAADIDAAFARSGIGGTPSPCLPLSFLSGEAFLTADAVGDQIELAWHGVEGAVSYQLSLASFPLGSGVGSTGHFTPLDTAITDTSFTLDGRHLSSDYLISVAPVDASGQPGYSGLPVFIDRQLQRQHPRFREEPSGRAQARGASATARILFNSPNPFNPTTRIVFEVLHAGRVHVQVFDVAGRLVRDLSDSAYAAGVHSVSWDGVGDDGQSVASGAYFAVISGSDWRDSRKIVLLK